MLVLTLNFYGIMSETVMQLQVARGVTILRLLTNTNIMMFGYNL